LKCDTDGGWPNNQTEGTDGSRYGTTLGTFHNGLTEHGTAFKLSPDGEFTVLTRDCFGFSCIDAPLAGLVQASDGNFYGTTVAGGKFSNGAIFQVTPIGELRTVHSFYYEDGVDVVHPEAPMIEGTNGALYGTTVSGGIGGGSGDAQQYAFR